MASGEHLRLGETSSGKCAHGRPGRPVELPVATVGGGRGFVAGEPGASPSDSAGLLARTLAERDHGVLVVDDTGGYLASLSGHEVLHVGGSRACDLWFTAEMADSVARMAFEGPVVVLDRSTYRDEAEADDAVAAVARRLFSIAGDRAGSVLAVVEGIEAYLPADGSNGEPGRILRRIVRRGGDRGLGVCGVSRQPADVDRSFVEQCDWRLWHRLTSNRNATVVRRQLDGEHSSAVRQFDDREAFLVEDGAGSVRRVAVSGGAGAGGEDRGRSTGADSRGRADRLAALCDRFDELEDRFAALEAELETRSDPDLAGTFDGHAERVADRVVDRLAAEPASIEETASADGPEGRAGTRSRSRDGSASGDGATAGGDSSDDVTAGDASADDGMAAFGAMMDGSGSESGNGRSAETNGSEDAGDEGSAAEGLAALAGVGTSAGGDERDDRSAHDESPSGSSGDTESDVPSIPSVDSQLADFERGAAAGVLADVRSDSDGRPAVVGRLEAVLASLDRDAGLLLERYRDEGAAPPDDAYREATGSPDRVAAYAANRRLRRAGLVEHVGRGHYEYCLTGTIAAGCDDDRGERMAETYVRDLEQEYLDEDSATGSGGVASDR